MREAEESIEKVLRGLRNSTAPDGMESRVLAGIEARASAPTHANWRWRSAICLVAPHRLVAPVSMAGGALLAGIIALAVMTMSHRQGYIPVRTQRNSASVQTIPSAPSIAPEAAAKDAHSLSRRSGTRSMRRMRLRQVRAARASDSVALREMRAASHPAPPLPLTEQEKLLLRVVLTGSPQEMAMLNPEIRAREEADDAAKFQRFLKQSKYSN